MDYLNDSVLGPDSPLSSLASRSPSPPPAYPSPSASQSESERPDGENEAGSQDEDGPPRKKRRTAEPKPRTTYNVDLSQAADIEDDLSSTSSGIKELVKALESRQKIVVIAGAGISVSAGIPDFRSSKGLFTTLRSKHKLKASGKHLFDASVYQDNHSTSSFHDMVREMSHMTAAAKPTQFHHMLARLAQEGRLLRLYSQNVDAIDTNLPPLATEVPLNRKGPWPKTIQLHGGLQKMVCSKCNYLSDFQAELFDGPEPPACQQCIALDEVRTEVAGKRSHGIGKLRPRMVLYNEHNPDDEAIGAVTQADLRLRPDAVIVVGTSLKVPGVRRIVREMCGVVQARRSGVTIWVSNSPVPSGKDLEGIFDITVEGNCQDVAQLAGLKQWDDSFIGPYTEVEAAKVEAKKKLLLPLLKTPKKSHLYSLQGIPTPSGSPHRTSLVPAQDEGLVPMLKLPTLKKVGQTKLSKTTKSASGKIAPKKRVTKSKHGAAAGSIKLTQILKTTKVVAKSSSKEDVKPKALSKIANATGLAASIPIRSTSPLAIRDGNDTKPGPDENDKAFNFLVSSYSETIKPNGTPPRGMDNLLH